MKKTWAEFRKRAMKFTLTQLRCDEESPCDAILALIEDFGEKYEPFVLRLQREADANWTRMASKGPQ